MSPTSRSIQKSRSKCKSYKKEDEFFLDNEDYKWVTRQRGEQLPKKHVYAGRTKIDGKVYIGKINNTPGKVNIDNNKIWNFWVRDYDHTSHQCGEVLIINCGYTWEMINRYNRIPDRAIKVGKDANNDFVWVGKSLENEPGKINCQDNNSTTPTMHNFWSHGGFISSQSAYILVLEEGEMY